MPRSTPPRSGSVHLRIPWGQLCRLVWDGQGWGEGCLGPPLRGWNPGPPSAHPPLIATHPLTQAPTRPAPPPHNDSTEGAPHPRRRGGRGKAWRGARSGRRSRWPRRMSGAAPHTPAACGHGRRGRTLRAGCDVVTKGTGRRRPVGGWGAVASAWGARGKGEGTHTWSGRGEPPPGRGPRGPGPNPGPIHIAAVHGMTPASLVLQPPPLPPRQHPHPPPSL